MNSNYVAELCNSIIRHCNSTIPIIRRTAATFLYFLIKKNYVESGNFSRVKVQTTISLSKLVGKGLRRDVELRESLSLISKYGHRDLDQSIKKKSTNKINNHFSAQVDELSAKLHTILTDSLKISEYAEDPEMYVDLLHRVAKGYSNAPDLRVAWLESIGNFHSLHKNYGEAGVAYLHIAALVSEYLNLFEPTPGIPVGCAAFGKITANSNEEASLHDLNPDEEGVCESHFFTEDQLIRLMNEGISYLKQAELWESCSEVYKLILPIYEKNRNYESLSKSHADLHHIFAKIAHMNKQAIRMLGSYYRVGFYGDIFAPLELQNKEFIYKEPKITRLGEIQDRLLKIFAPRVGGEDKLKVLPDSNPPNISKLNKDFGYLQITSVVPYFESWELKDRPSYYDKYHNISRIIR